MDQELPRKKVLFFSRLDESGLLVNKSGMRLAGADVVQDALIKHHLVDNGPHNLNMKFLSSKLKEAR